MKAKRILASVIAMLTATSMLAGCSTSTSETSTATSSETVATSDAGSTNEFEPMTIAFGTNAVDEKYIAAKEAFDNVIGPLLNIEFIYSEQLNDAGALITFIENAYASGADAVFTNLSNSIDQAAAVCEELGLYFVGVNSAGATENTELPHYISVVGATDEGYGEAYGQLIKNLLSDGDEHGILILSGAAAYGATSFIEGTAGSLRALEEIYGLTYTEDVNTLATSAVQVDAENDKGIKITIFPGMTDLATNVSPLLQTGEYDVVVGTTDIYSSLGVAINEVEEALNMNIKVINRTVFSDSMQTAFNTTDSQGDTVVNGLVVNGLFENVGPVLFLRNAFDGYSENMRDDGHCSRVPGMAPLAISSAEEYNALSADDIPYAFFTEEDLLSLCGPDVTWQDINDFGAAMNAETLMAKFAG